MKTEVPSCWRAESPSGCQRWVAPDWGQIRPLKPGLPGGGQIRILAREFQSTTSNRVIQFLSLFEVSIGIAQSFPSSTQF